MHLVGYGRQCSASRVRMVKLLFLERWSLCSYAEYSRYVVLYFALFSPICAFSVRLVIPVVVIIYSLLIPSLLSCFVSEVGSFMEAICRMLCFSDAVSITFYRSIIIAS